MTDENENEQMIDPEVKETLEELPGEEPFLTGYVGGDSGENESITFADKWFPGSEEWQGKTNITPEQAHALSLLRALPDAYEEMEELQPFFEKMVKNYEMYLTSIDGKAREEQASILKSVFGGSGELDDAEKSMVMSAFANPDDDD